MIAFLDGVIAGKTQTSAFIKVGGVGFEVTMPTSGLAHLPEIGGHAMVYTYMQVRDDGMFLFGFLSSEEKALFEKLISVSSVGPKIALAALSYYDPEKLVTLIAEQNVAAIQRIPGIGKKMASRIILELKGSLDKGLASLFGHSELAESQAMHDASSALLSMGFTSVEIEVALQGAPVGASDSALLQYALKKLGS